MDSVCSTISLPFRSSEKISVNQTKQLSIYDAQKQLESCLSQEQMRAINMANVDSGAVSKEFDINSFAISIASGESLWLLFHDYPRLDGFKCQAIRHRDAKLFLVDDPDDERVKKAAKTVCHKQPGVFSLYNEVRSLTIRTRSLQALPSECGDILQDITGIDLDELILLLSLKGFYLQNGFARCNGCKYRKGLRDFAVLVAREIKKRGAKSIMSALMLPTANDVFAGHHSANCYNGETTRKTLLSISDPCGVPLEHPHYSVYHDDWTNHYCSGYTYSFPDPISRAKKRDDLDQYLFQDSMIYLFTTTIPKSQFLTQDDLLYEASTIKFWLDNLRDRYDELKRLVDQFNNTNPSSARAFRLPKVDSLLSPQIGKVYSKVIVKMMDKKVKALVQHDKAGLQRLLDHLLALIENSGGAVASQGLRCLAIRPLEQDFLQYITPQNAPSPSEDSDELEKIRHQFNKFRNDYAQAIISEVLSPLLEIFNPFELSHAVLQKVFGVSDAYIASLVPPISLCDGIGKTVTVTHTSNQIDVLPALHRRKRNTEVCRMPATPSVTEAPGDDIKKHR